MLTRESCLFVLELLSTLQLTPGAPEFEKVALRIIQLKNELNFTLEQGNSDAVRAE